MLCVVCTRPIQNFQEENKVCKLCALRIKLKGDCKGDIFDMDSVKLESLQQQLFHDLNLEEDSDYEAELNYLMQANKALILSKEKNMQPSKSKEDVKEYPNEHYEELKHKAESKIRNNASMPEFFNVVNKNVEPTSGRNSFSNLQFGDMSSTQNIQRRPQIHGTSSQPIKEKQNRRVSIKTSAKCSFISVENADINSNQSHPGKPATACRAVFHPTQKHCEPRPQFEKIHKMECQSDFVTSSKALAFHDNKNPFICPVTYCKNIIPVSDLIKHFKLNHIRVPIVPVDPGACMNIFWEVKVDQFRISQCLMLLLTNGKFKEFGCGQFKNCLPLAVMTTKIKLSELADIQSDREDDTHFYMIWLTEMSSSDEPVYYTITAWNDMNGARVHVVNTTQSYTIRADQNPKIIYGSGKAMILTSEQINKLSNNNQEMIKLQVVVH